jgi:cell division septal protein FtsQ
MRLKRKPKPIAKPQPASGLKPQPRPKRTGRPTKRPSIRARLRGGRGARRPGVPMRHRLTRRLPSMRRVLAGVGAVAVAAGLVTLLSGPWLRVTDVSWSGETFTAPRDLERVVGGRRGANLLALDTRVLRDQLAALPAVAEATINATLPGRLDVTIVEREVAFVWQTSSARLLGAADGTVFAALRRDEALAPELATMPRVVDQRTTARLMTVGDRIPDDVLRTALRLADLDPAALGSQTTALGVQLDDEFGFRLVAPDMGWELALGPFGIDPTETAADAAARLERQVTAVRTLFASRAEAEIGWVDARNPGKVYFRAKG